ncbi:MAG TPA: hypothetical protein PKC28_12495 [Bdellovibrionales bacterium]|nr:hypothetical protein [Bdellovibrionales bacterium]
MKSLIIGLIVASPLMAFAAGPPVKTPACGEKIRIKAPKGGAGVVFDETCETGYVLPPVFGSVEVTGTTWTVADEDCKEYEAGLRRRGDLADKIAGLETSEDEQDGAGSTLNGGGGGLTQPGNDEEGQTPAETLEEFEERKKLYEAYRADLDKLRESMEVFDQTEGLILGLTYTLDHEQMVEKYQELNPRINFARVQLEQAYISAAVKSGAEKEESSIVLDYVMPGVNEFPGAGGEKLTAPKDGIYFGSVQPGKIRFTTKGACLVKRSEGKKKEMSAKNFTTIFSPKVTYSYALMAKRAYKASYDYKMLIEEIRKSTKKGGFLSSSTVNELIRRKEGDNWFKFQAMSDDTRFQQEVVVQEVKADVIGRVLNQIAENKVPGEAQGAPLLEPGKKGVDVAAEGFKKCPHPYCQVAGYVLDFVGATFGSSSAVSRFLSTVDMVGKDEVTESKALQFIGDSAFKAKL